ncbi:Flp pilus assembly protein CpaB [Psychromonas sp. MB-3u-54]|uniref:Flp pilus assembly protein CpaB n=1 Tax=Psychromonas sp. MB-3u-54 TaxID=2058319 RepID=UPI000C3304C6|nr:Flp pilus assembly protein CpaB [Psychromonas sp. MB-3u-54]PKH02746.1 Flp pilus assembly protein CpaB [Psychromonas sp. MB-3u-54]
MNKKTLMFIILSVVFGLGAVLIAQNWLAENQPEDLTAGQIKVFTVNTDLSVGTILDPKYIVSTVMPKNLLAAGTITDKSLLEEVVVKQKLFQGDIITQQRLAKKGEGSSLASLIGKNMRAVTIRVNDVVGVAGFLLPGNKVDVLNTYNGKGKKVSTDVILSNVKILAVDQKASYDENKPQIVRAVTLELSLEQAEILMNAQDKGDIQLALRNPNDQADTSTLITASVDKPLSVTEVAVVDSSLEANNLQTLRIRHKIEIIRGVIQESIQLKTTNGGLQNEN